MLKRLMSSKNWVFQHKPFKDPGIFFLFHHEDRLPVHALSEDRNGADDGKKPNLEDSDDPSNFALFKLQTQVPTKWPG